jgi:hypothetical protein
MKTGKDWFTQTRDGISPEVRALALNPGRKIAAIKLHRDKNPDFRAY